MPFDLDLAQHDIGLAQAGTGGRVTQLEHNAEAPFEERLGQGSPGWEEEPEEASRGPARAQGAVLANQQSAAVELTARDVKRQPTE